MRQLSFTKATIGTFGLSRRARLLGFKSLLRVLQELRDVNFLRIQKMFGFTAMV